MPARFSAGVFNGFFFAFFLLSIPLLMMASQLPMVGWVAQPLTPLRLSDASMKAGGFVNRLFIGRILFSYEWLLKYYDML
ncbi:hypothetical protein SPRA44_260089 [Serratia proteamaculans]|nr:hypothetical protein SPRA44_260089 [Serratia proteamaculans]